MSSPFPGDQRSRAVVLVHGAWVGEWSWGPVLADLERSGRPIHCVSLRGHGVRARESSPSITLADHVDDVVDLVETFDLESITLVGHSYGGRVITRAWPRLAGRVERLIYLDAHAPLGDSAIRYATGHLSVEDGMIPFTRFDPDPDEFGGDESVRWFLSRLRPQSAATLAADFVVDLPDDLDLTYVAATGEHDSPFAGYAAAAAASPQWRLIELDCSHWLMVARARDVAAIILDPSGWQQKTPAHTTTGDAP